MSLRAVVLVFYLTLAAVVSAESTIEASHKPEQTAAGGKNTQFPLGSLPMPMQTLEFGGLDNSAAPELAERASIRMTCGPEVGSCPKGLCCSPHGIFEMPSMLSSY
jgi:hypothetical protein